MREKSDISQERHEILNSQEINMPSKLRRYLELDLILGDLEARTEIAKKMSDAASAAPPAAPPPDAGDQVTERYDAELADATGALARARKIVTDINAEFKEFGLKRKRYPDAALLTRVRALSTLDARVQKLIGDSARLKDARVKDARAAGAVTLQMLDWDLAHRATAFELLATGVYVDLTDTLLIGKRLATIQARVEILYAHFVVVAEYAGIPSTDVDDAIKGLDTLFVKDALNNATLGNAVTLSSKLANVMYPAYLNDDSVKLIFSARYEEARDAAIALHRKMVPYYEVELTKQQPPLPHDPEVVKQLGGIFDVAEDTLTKTRETDLMWLATFILKFDDSGYASHAAFFEAQEAKYARIISDDITKRRGRPSFIPAPAPALGGHEPFTIVADNGELALALSRFVRIRNVKLGGAMENVLRTSNGDTLSTPQPLFSRFNNGNTLVAISVFHSLCATLYGVSRREGGVDWSRGLPVFLTDNVVYLGPVQFTLPPIANIKAVISRRGALVMRSGVAGGIVMIFIKKDPASARIMIEGVSIVAPSSALAR
jgi:hypothetical protein